MECKPLHGTLRGLPVILLLAMIAGCQTAPVEPEPEPSPPPPVIEPEPEPEPPPPPPLATDLRSVVELMERGQASLARDSLVALIAEQRNPRIMNALLQQLETDPVELFGSDHYEITVQPGDTLSVLAGQHLGDPLLFYGLARYNGIEEPRLLDVGQQLRIPRRTPGDAEDTRSDIERIGSYLIASGDQDDAWKALLQAADSGNLSVPGQQELFELAMAIADRQLAAGLPDAAIQTLQETVQRFESGTYHTDLQARILRMQNGSAPQAGPDQQD